MLTAVPGFGGLGVHLAPCHDGFRGPGLDAVEIRWHKKQQLFYSGYWDHGIPVVKVSDRYWHVMSLCPVPLKVHRVGERCPLNLSRAQTSSRWCEMVVRR
ncbi:hypothetical protein TNCV_850131 [Trichonephila clavipes]|uniref:Uncharacterized protein n=1 Tax=Trichonephila clavipes TaxID=2585209 RepID=A0A8X6RZ05_TRICX|nr:hypothetical protein TNCV_850131 [Trichonephila clavipes]